MGPKNACANADTAIGTIEIDVMEKKWRDFPILWAVGPLQMYVPWTYGPELLKCFYQWLNYRIPGIKCIVNSPEHGTEF